MAPTQAKKDNATRLTESIEHAEEVSLEAVRKFLDTVDGVLPLGSDDGPRRKIIDSAFEMTEKLVSSSTKLAQNILGVTEKALGESERKSAASKSAASKK